MWPEDKYGFKDAWTKNDFQYFEEERLPLDDPFKYKHTGKLTEFEKDVARGTVSDRSERIAAMRADPFYTESRVQNDVKTPYDPMPGDVRAILARARSIDDIITACAYMITVVEDLSEVVRIQGDTVDYLENELRTLEIEKMGPPGKQGIPGATGPMGPPGADAPDLHQEILDQVNEYQELFKDLQEQIDDLAEEL